VTGTRLLRLLVHRGGLRADIVTDGTIRTGDAITPVRARAEVSADVLRGDALLLARRLVAHGRDTRSTPGGAHELGETVEACAVRELWEETGLSGTAGGRLAERIDYFPESGQIYRTTFVRVDVSDFSPRTREPHQHEAWAWVPVTNLPEPLFRPVATFVARHGTVLSRT
jgi:8-oxo-dGTP diphosphatase